MKLRTQEAARPGLPLRYAPSAKPVVRCEAAAGLRGFVSLRTPSDDASSAGHQTTVLHAERLYTQDWVPVNVVTSRA
jgi:hypothetical protein